VRQPHFQPASFGDENESLTLGGSHMSRGVPMADRLSQNLQE
jgi:hypothetical protein